MLSILYYITTAVVAIVLYILSWVAFILCYPFDKRRVVVHTISKWIILGARKRSNKRTSNRLQQNNH